MGAPQSTLLQSARAFHHQQRSMTYSSQVKSPHSARRIVLCVLPHAHARPQHLVMHTCCDGRQHVLNQDCSEHCHSYESVTPLGGAVHIGTVRYQSCAYLHTAPVCNVTAAFHADHLICLDCASSHDIRWLHASNVGSHEIMDIEQRRMFVSFEPFRC